MQISEKRTQISLDEMIRQILTEKNMTQQELASQLNISPSQISRWRYGDNAPRRRMKTKLQAIYDEILSKPTA